MPASQLLWRWTPAVALALLILAPCVAMAADPAAQAMVDNVYKSYMGKNANGIPIHSVRATALLTPGLLKLIDADARRAKAKGEVPELNGDPFVDAQDWDFKSYEAKIDDAGRKRARAVVTLTGADGSRKGPITLELVNYRGRWRIDDMTGANGSLRALLSKH